MPKKGNPIPSLTRKVKRGDKSNAMLRWGFGISGAIMSGLIVSSTLAQPYKALALIGGWLLLAVLFYRVEWFRNKFIGIVSRAEERWF